MTYKRLPIRKWLWLMLVLQACSNLVISLDDRSLASQEVSREVAEARWTRLRLVEKENAILEARIEQIKEFRNKTHHL